MKTFKEYIKEDKDSKLLEILNRMLELCEPITYDNFNKVLKGKDINKLRDYEKQHDEVGIARYGTPNEGISTLSIISTITDVLINKRLGVDIDDNDFITKFNFIDYKNGEKQKYNISFEQITNDYLSTLWHGLKIIERLPNEKIILSYDAKAKSGGKSYDELAQKLEDMGFYYKVIDNKTLELFRI